MTLIVEVCRMNYEYSPTFIFSTLSLFYIELYISCNSLSFEKVSQFVLFEIPY